MLLESSLMWIGFGFLLSFGLSHGVVLKFHISCLKKIHLQTIVIQFQNITRILNNMVCACVHMCDSISFNSFWCWYCIAQQLNVSCVNQLSWLDVSELYNYMHQIIVMKHGNAINLIGCWNTFRRTLIDPISK